MCPPSASPPEMFLFRISSPAMRFAHNHQLIILFLDLPLANQQEYNPYFSHFLRKEVIQPHLPIRLPCYDFTPVIRPAFGGSFLSVRSPTSGISDSHGVTGGVYKTRERIHRSILICDYERFQLHVVELQTTIRTETLFLRFAYPRRLASLCLRHCSTCVAQIIRGMMI